MTPRLWEQRLTAAGVDAGIVSLTCLGLAVCFGPLLTHPIPWLWMTSAVLLILVAGVELFTGITPGKWMTGLTLRTAAGRRPAMWQFVMRGIVKYLPVLVFLLSLQFPESFLLLSGVWVILVVCWVPLCYLPMLRANVTAFDMVAGTVLVATHDPPAAPATPAQKPA